MSTETATITGKVQWFKAGPGFGFIKRDDGQKDVFVHFSQIEMGRPGIYKCLYENQRVQFEIRDSSVKQGKVEAVNVRVVG